VASFPELKVNVTRAGIVTLPELVREHLRASGGSFALAVLCMIGFTLAELLSPWPLKIIFDHILLGRELPPSLSRFSPLMTQSRTTAVIALSLSILLIAGLRSVFAYFQTFITLRIGYELVFRLRQALFAHLQQLSLSFHARARTGELLTKVVSDTNALKDVFAESALNSVAHLITITGMFAVMFALNWQLALVVLATFPLLVYTLFTVYRRLKASARRQREREGLVASRIHEVLWSLHLVRAYAREKHEQQRFEEASSHTLAEGIRTARLEAAATRAVEIISAASLCAVVLAGALQVLSGRMLPGEMLIFTAYLNSMYKPLRTLARISSQFSKAVASAERIAGILSTEPEPADDHQGIRVSQLRGEIVFQHVTFAYEEGEEILHDLSFRIEPGQRVALVGASGAGKSTIASLLLRFYETQSGQILIDGRPIQKYQRESLRQQIGIVLQETVLFGATIRENICYGKPDATEAEIEAAARDACAHGFIMALPEGYETVIGERGSTLSGGQRQRLCLARAIIRRPSVLILDEPTTAIDAESTALIQQAINRLQQGRTLIVISHQFGGIESFDQILVLKDGCLIERGTHRELLQLKGCYYDLFRLQRLA
jgi:ABC-type multidrug transport system fused ATPase/permease subunit